MTRILCLWFPNWAIQRAIRCRPELKRAGGGAGNCPVVSKGTAGRASSGTQSIVAACCGRAVKQGVRPGMPLAEAQALVRDLKVAAYEPAADRRALVKLAEACERFSPRVALEEGESRRVCCWIFRISNTCVAMRRSWPGRWKNFSRGVDIACDWPWRKR